MRQVPQYEFLQSLLDTELKTRHGLLTLITEVGQSSDVEWLLDLLSFESVRATDDEVHTSVKVVEAGMVNSVWNAQRLLRDDGNT